MAVLGPWRVEVHASGNSVDFTLDRYTAPQLRQAILDQMEAARVGAAPRTPSSNDSAADLLERLAELHRAGVLTDEEFASKNAELLDRM